MLRMKETQCLLVVCHFLRTVTNWEHFKETRGWLHSRWSYQPNPPLGTSIRAYLTNMTRWKNQCMRQQMQTRWRQTNHKVCCWISLSTRALVVGLISLINLINQMLTISIATLTLQQVLKTNLKNQNTTIIHSLT